MKYNMNAYSVFVILLLNCIQTKIMIIFSPIQVSHYLTQILKQGVLKRKQKLKNV